MASRLTPSAIQDGASRRFSDWSRDGLGFIQPRPIPTLDEIKAVLDEDAKPENFVDLGLMQELEKEKFFEKLK